MTSFATIIDDLVSKAASQNMLLALIAHVVCLACFACFAGYVCGACWLCFVAYLPCSLCLHCLFRLLCFVLPCIVLCCLTCCCIALYCCDLCFFVLPGSRCFHTSACLIVDTTQKPSKPNCQHNKTQHNHITNKLNKRSNTTKPNKPAHQPTTTNKPTSQHNKTITNCNTTKRANKTHIHNEIKANV